MTDPLTDEGLYSLWQSDDHKQTVITSAVPVTLDATTRPGAGASLAVYADAVTIAPAFAPADAGAQAPFGASVTVVAREITCASAVTVDVAGAPGKGYPAGDSAGRGHDDLGADGQPGGKGDDGQPGDVGGAGGAVLVVAGALTGGGALHVVSDGGPGGRGQDGGPGGRGGNGGPGMDARGTGGDWGDQPSYWPGDHGQDGGQGGQGGAPGYGGSGGDAGPVTVLLGVAPAGAVTGSAGGGVVGPTGTPGAGGAPGPVGGGGGMNKWCGFRAAEGGDPDRWDCDGGDTLMQLWVGQDEGGGDIYQDRGPAGWAPGGSAGQPAPAPPPPNGKQPQPGATRAPRIASPADNAAALQAIPDAGLFLALAQMQLHAVERLYLDGQVEEVAARLGWLFGLSNQKAPASWPDAQAKELIALNQRVVALLAQMRAGTDYYGFAQTYAPVLSLDYYADALSTTYIPLAQDVESAYESYFDKAQSQQVQRQKLETSLGSCNALIKKWGDQITTLAGQLDATQKAIADLAGQLQSDQQQILGPDMAAFRDAVYQASGPECSWLDIVQCVVSLVGIAAGVGEIGVTTAAIAGIKGFDEAGSQALSDIAVAIKRIEAVSEALDQIAAGFTELDEIRSKYGNDAGKLAVPGDGLAQDEAQFDQNMKPYLDNPKTHDAAALFQQQMHAFFDLGQTYNKKLIDADTLRIAIAAVQAKIVLKQAQIARLQQQMLGDYDPTIAPYAAFLGEAYSALREELLRELDLETKAYAYWSLQPLSMADALGQPPLGVTVAAFANAQTTIQQAREAVMSKRGGPTTFQQVSWELPADLFAHIKTEPATQRHLVTFNLPPVLPATPEKDTPFPAMALVGVTKVNVWVTGAATGDQWLLVRLVHSGNSQVVDQSGNVSDFTHDPVAVPFRYNLQTKQVTQTGEVVLSPTGQDFIELSPFAQWVLQLDPDPSQNNQLDVSAVTSIRIDFWGTFYTFPRQGPTARREGGQTAR